MWCSPDDETVALLMLQSLKTHLGQIQSELGALKEEVSELEKCGSDKSDNEFSVIWTLCVQAAARWLLHSCLILV